jgi:hypothetical protein
MAENSTSKISIPQLIFIPALITLAVTLLRLIGELQRWPTTLFGREGGGGGAIIGITWLVFVFGIYFGYKLTNAGEGPSSVGRTIGFAVLGLFVTAAGIAISIPGGKLNFPGKEVIGLLLAAAGGLIPILAGWSRLGWVLLAYGYAVRIPVLIIMYFSIRGNWDTHYSKGPPGVEFPDFWTKFIKIAVLPQLIFWIAFTIIMGSIFGGVAAAIARRRRNAAVEQPG